MRYQYQPQFIGGLHLSDESGPPYTLDAALTYVSNVTVQKGLKYADAGLGTIVVPAGFPTDLASIPKLLQNVLAKSGKYDKAAVVHDFLYVKNGVTRAQADAVLYEAMGVLGVPARTRWIIYVGVRVGGWKPWGEYRKGTK